MQFGPEPETNFIMYVESGKKIMMKRKGGSCVIEANIVKKLKLGLPGRPRERG